MSEVRELTWKIATEGFDKLSKDVNNADKSIEKTKRSMSSVESKLKTIGSIVTAKGKEITSLGNKITKFTAPLAVAGAAGFKMAGDLDKAIRQVSTLTTKDILPVDKIRKEVRSISDETGKAQKEVAESMYQALSAGVSQDKVAEFTRSAINLTEGGFTDMTTAIDTTTTVLNAYGNKAYDVSKINDILVETQNKGKITVDQLGQNIGRVIPTAAALGVNLDQLGAAYSMLTAKGQNPQIATTNLNMLLAELGKSGSKADKVLRSKLGKGFLQLSQEGKNVGEVLGILNDEAKANGQSLSDMFGSMNAGNAALTLLSDGTEGYNKLVQDMQNSQGVAKANAEKMGGPFKQFSDAVNKSKNALIDLGAAAAPYISKFAVGVSKLVDKFNKLSPSMKDSIAEWGLLVVAAGPAISIIGGIISVGGTLITGLGIVVGIVSSVASTIISAVSLVSSVAIPLISAVSAPIWIVVGAIGALILIGRNLYKHWAQVRQQATALGGGLKGYLLASLKITAQGFTSLRDKALSALQSIKDKWNAIKNFLAHPIKGVINVTQSIFGSGAKSKSDGSHATGLNNVPFDNYIGKLHAGEMVLPAKTASLYRNYGGDINHLPTGKGTNFAPTINISINGNADRETANHIANVVKKELDNMFRDLRLQRA